VITGAEFPREARLLQPDDFLRALKTRAQRGKYLWVYRRLENSAGEAVLRPQLGLMISKKNARTAVLRNAIKRRVREQFRLRQSVLPAQQYVVRLSASVKITDVQQVIGEWTHALERDAAKFHSLRGELVKGVAA
jgi:ribonuclease P protein component